MKRFTSYRRFLRGFLCAISSALVVACLSGAPAFAQGARMHPGGIVSRPGGSWGPRPIIGPRIFPRPGIYRVRTLVQTFAPPRFLFFGAPISGFGLGLRGNASLWRDCVGFWSYACGSFPVYYVAYEGGGRQLPQLYLKDGTVYNVTDYWLVNGQLHYTTLDESGTTWNEHVIDFSQLDVQKTADIAERRGFHFVLRNEPMEQYLKDHPNIGSPGEAPPPVASPTPTQPIAPTPPQAQPPR
jgi:hypothetical protein